jgi:hypothetical protein
MSNTIYSQVKEYSYMLWTQQATTWGEASVMGKMNCFGDDFLLLMLFVEEGSPIPAAKVHHWPSKKKVDLYIPFSKMPYYLDLLRHEKPVFVHIDLDSPEKTSFSTDKNHSKEDRSEQH